MTQDPDKSQGPDKSPPILSYERNLAAREAESDPLRAFSRGVGVVFQTVGVVLFLSMMLVCCVSSIAGPGLIRPDQMDQGWQLPWDAPGEVGYPVPLGLTVSLSGGIVFGLALAALGLGMQGEHVRAAYGAVLASGVGMLFWLVQAVFIFDQVGSILLGLMGIGLTGVFALLLALAAGAARELVRHPPPAGHEVLPADYQVPYSHLHQDRPEVRLAREIEQRRQRLEVQQKELETMERELKRRMKDEGGMLNGE